MKIKFLLIIAALLFVSNNKVQSQERFSKSQLSGLTVLFGSNNDHVYNPKTKEYETHRITISNRWDDVNMYGEVYIDSVMMKPSVYKYYLSDVKDDFFDVSKCEKSTEGRYIIVGSNNWTHYQAMRATK